MSRHSRPDPAIVGPARADLYFGAGADAGRVAGRIKQMGRFVMLVPGAIDPAAFAGGLRLPTPRPHIADQPVPLPLPRPRPNIDAEPKVAGSPRLINSALSGSASAANMRAVVRRS